MNTEEVFLSCSNLTLGQYRAIALTRGLTGAAGCVISLAVLGIVLLTMRIRKRAWENLLKRIYFAIVLYTLLHSIVAIAAVNYLHPPSQESAWCEALGFLLHYTGTLLIVHYCALAFSAVFQVTAPVYLEAVRKKKHINIHGPKKAKLWGEVLLFLLLLLCPLLNSWEPFLPQLPFYGNYGPLCWFRLELTDNCTTNKSDELFLITIPFAVVCFGSSVLTFTVSLALCCMYCKFRAKTIGSRIIRVIPTTALVTVITFMMMLWYILSAIPRSHIGSFSWLGSVTVTLAGAIAMLVVVGVYVHFPTHLCCLRCNRALHREGEQNEHQVIRPPQAANHNTRCSRTMYTNPHSPVTTVTAETTETIPLISSHRPEVDHHKYHTYTTCSISHEPVTTDLKK